MFWAQPITWQQQPTLLSLTLMLLPSLSTTPTQAQGSVLLLLDTSTNSPTCGKGHGASAWE
jgi:hypothetical protein